MGNVGMGNNMSVGGGYRCDGPSLASAGTLYHIGGTRKVEWTQGLLRGLDSGLAMSRPLVKTREPNRCLALGKSRLTLESIMITYTSEDVLVATCLGGLKRTERLHLHC